MKIETVVPNELIEAAVDAHAATEAQLVAETAVIKALRERVLGKAQASSLVFILGTRYLRRQVERRSTTGGTDVREKRRDERSLVIWQTHDTLPHQKGHHTRPGRRSGSSAGGASSSLPAAVRERCTGSMACAFSKAHLARLQAAADAVPPEKRTKPWTPCAGPGCDHSSHGLEVKP